MLSEIRERKLVQWVVAYVVGAFIVLQGLELVTEAFPGFAIVLQVVLILALLGLPVAIVLAWFHGEKGRQRVSLTEAVILLVVVAAGGAAVFQFDVYGADPGPPGLEPLTVTLDSSRYAVLPFRRGTGVGEALNEDTQIHDALARWQGIDVVDLVPLRTQLDDPDRPAEEGLGNRRVAARVGAGRYVSGTVTSVGDRVRVHAALFDTRTGVRLADRTLQVDAGQPLPAADAAELGRALLFPGADDVDIEDAAPYTRSVPALRAFAAARQAVREGRLAAGDSLFAEASERDPDFARPLLWRAQVATWNGRAPEEVLTLVEAAAARRDQLNAREQLMTDGLLQLARDQYAEACDTYRALRDRDERDFVAWYGLGECRAQDDVVIRDTRSPSGWAFRSSYHRAVQAYGRALGLLPTNDVGISSGMFKGVGQNRLKVSTGAVRRGRVLSPDTLAMAARPAWTHDTLAFIPYPTDEVAAGRPGARPATLWTAVERQRRLYNKMAESWVARFPRSPEALEALAHAQEFLSNPKALETLAAARELTDDPSRRRMMNAEMAKLLVKFGSAEEYAAVRARAGSVLRLGDPATPEEMETVAVLAALTGRANRAARLVRDAAVPFEWVVRLPVAVMGPAAALDAFAAMGGPVDSIAANGALVRAALENRVAPEDRELASTMLLSRAASLAYPLYTLAGFHGLAEGGYPLLRAQSAHARGDDTEALRIMSEIRSNRQSLRRAQVSFDAAYPESRLWAALGDTATAVVVLDGTLNTLRWSEPGSLADVERAGSLVRAMAFRAELAAAMDDGSTAHRWAEAVLALWADADPGLRPLVRRMRAIDRQARN